MKMSALELFVLQNKSEEVAENVFPNAHLDQSIAVVKSISTVLERFGYAPPAYEEMDLLNPERFHQVKLQMLQALTKATIESMEELENAEELQRLYSPGDIARFMGLSHTTISKYIEGGRFQGVERPEPGRHVDIPGHTIFTYPSGTVVTVSKIVKDYNARLYEAEHQEKLGEVSFIESKIKQYEEKYNCNLQQLENSLNESGSSSENIDTIAILDLDVWKYLESRREALLV